MEEQFPVDGGLRGTSRGAAWEFIFRLHCIGLAVCFGKLCIERGSRYVRLRWNAHRYSSCSVRTAGAKISPKNTRAVIWPVGTNALRRVWWPLRMS
jgi:hypothetical protein